jgi:hypothetical protein
MIDGKYEDVFYIFKTDIEKIYSMYDCLYDSFDELFSLYKTKPLYPIFHESIIFPDEIKYNVKLSEIEEKIIFDFYKNYKDLIL